MGNERSKFEKKRKKPLKKRKKGKNRDKIVLQKSLKNVFSRLNSTAVEVRLGLNETHIPTPPPIDCHQEMRSLSVADGEELKSMLSCSSPRHTHFSAFLCASQWASRLRWWLSYTSAASGSESKSMLLPRLTSTLFSFSH